jgi:hypothetical protein
LLITESISNGTVFKFLMGPLLARPYVIPLNECV